MPGLEPQGQVLTNNTYRLDQHPVLQGGHKRADLGFREAGKLPQHAPQHRGSIGLVDIFRHPEVGGGFVQHLCQAPNRISLGIPPFNPAVPRAMFPRDGEGGLDIPRDRISIPHEDPDLVKAAEVFGAEFGREFRFGARLKETGVEVGAFTLDPDGPGQKAFGGLDNDILFLGGAIPVGPEGRKQRVPRSPGVIGDLHAYHFPTFSYASIIF